MGGVVRTRNLIRSGYSRHRIDRALASGSLARVRKGWVAVPGADAYLVAAARAGVVVSCISQARRLGLWVLDEDRPHVAAPAHSGCATPRDATVHWAKPLVPRHPDALTDPIENVLVLVAQCQPFEAALAVWESALRRGLLDRQALERMPLPTAVRNVLGSALPFSDSGLESFVVPRLAWMKIPLVPQVWIAGHRVDFLIGERLVLQIDGGHHVGEQRESDIEHDAELMLLGYHVIRVGYSQIVDRWQTVQDHIVRAVAQGLHRTR
ncbi:DNA/RNA helicase [Agromyces sp. Root81]|nr:DNA/RNA helicase [Agromyces sp. Root81]